MDTCPYYHEHGTSPNVIRCCAHKHSPIPCFTNAPVSEAVRLLKCRGRLSHCEIPTHELLDVN